MAPGTLAACHRVALPDGAVMKGRVLVVDDDVALAEMLGIVLRGEGIEPFFVFDGDKALAAFRETRPDLVLLDLMLPGTDGIDVCRQIRAESGVPIVMLTAKSDTVDVVVGLESGADDYVVKPFKPKELVARLRARLRRSDDPTAESITIGDLSIDVAGHAVSRDGGSDPVDALGVRPARRAREEASATCSPARCCSSRCGATGTRPTPGSLTCTCSGCDRRSSAIPSALKSW